MRELWESGEGANAGAAMVCSTFDAMAEEDMRMSAFGDCG